MLLLVATLASAAVAPVGISPVGRTVEIAPNVFMPSVNLGTCCGSDPKVGIDPWFGAGGTGIDTALSYRDQPEIGEILKSAGRSRESYFITTKIPSHGSLGQKLTADFALKQVQEDVKELGVDYVDLVLIHHPAKTDEENHALWKGMEQAVAMNLTRSIGLSNYNKEQIEALLKIATIRPSVNQCDMSITKHDTQCTGDGSLDDAIAFNQAQNITYEAWSPMKGCPFTDPAVEKIATAHNVSTSQVCLRWVIEKGCVIAVGTGSDKSSVEQYTHENLDLFGFQLSSEEMDELAKLVPDQN